jgi:hypothetical protein
MSLYTSAVCWVIFGSAAILAYAVVSDALRQRATKRRNAYRDARRRHPAGKALAHTSGHCPSCAEKGVCLCPSCVREAYTGEAS